MSDVRMVEVKAGGQIEAQAVRFVRWQIGRVITAPAFEITGGEPEIEDPWRYMFQRGYLDLMSPNSELAGEYIAGQNNVNDFFREQGGINYQRAYNGWSDLFQHVNDGHRNIEDERHRCGCPLEYDHVEGWGFGFLPETLVQTYDFLGNRGNLPMPKTRYRRRTESPSASDVIQIYGGALRSQLPE